MRAVVRCGSRRVAVLCSADGILSEFDRPSGRGRGRGHRAAARPRQHDAGRLAEPVAEPDATSGVAAITGVEAGAAVAKAIAGDGVALADGDSTDMPAAAGAAGRSSGRAEVPVAFAFETMTSAGVGFTTASLAFGLAKGVWASANCVPSSVFTSTPGIGLGSIAGTDDSI